MSCKGRIKICDCLVYFGAKVFLIFPSVARIIVNSMKNMPILCFHQSSKKSGRSGIWPEVVARS
jgi:hypothetical protein